MVENLLHQDVVLSKDQYDRLRSADLTGFLASHDSDKIGVLTFLGTDNVQGKTVYLLLRFEKGQYTTPVTPDAIEATFGKKFSVMYGNNLCTSGSEWRVLITCELDKKLGNALGFLYAKSKRLAEAMTKKAIEYSETDEYWSDYLGYDITKPCEW